MKNNKENIIFTFETSLLVSIIAFTLTYLISYFWLRDGFDMLEVSFLSITSSVIFFFTFLIVCILHTNLFIRESLKNNKKYFNKYFLLFLVFIFSLSIFTLLDTLIFYLVDDSIPIEFSKALEKLAQNSGQKLEGMDEFKNMSFSIQNSILNLISLIISSLICIPFIKKDGELFRSNLNDYR